MNFRQPLAAFLLPLALSLPVAASAAPQAVQAADGTYLGFNQVDVQGQLFDVRFVDGSFDSLFGGVPQFALESQASAAANRLRQLLGGFPVLDAEPSKMAGCGSHDTSACYVLTSDAEFSSLPTDVDVIALRNGRESESVLNGLQAMSFDTSFDTALDNIGPGGAHSYVWAEWSPAVPVPEPSSLALLAAGLGVVATRRRAAARA